MQQARVSVVTVAYGAEPWLERSVRACLDSSDVSVDVVVVDNGCTDGAVDMLRAVPGVTVVGDGTNLGFAAGCNLGAARATGDLLALVNPDAIVEPNALARLAAVATRDSSTVATASVRLADRPELLNACGLALHFLGVSWAGHYEEPAAHFAREHEVLGGSGAAMVLPRRLWDDIGGFAGEFFAYYEDCDFAVRLRQRGGRALYVPDAIVTHRYEFSRNPRKFFLAERNRSVMVLSLWQARTLVVLAPALLSFELAVLMLAVRQGWWREKFRAWWWLLRHARWIGRRRRVAQSARTVPDRALLAFVEGHLDPGNFPLPPALAPLQRALETYWRVVRRFV
ncbi:MAG TPA: glycosyltransferase family 2 protein [Acidimicrobiales bacterium]|jgi:GT2 family glycosyltransferase|nr:glycosyltransferase family 2 protein [Acidimicrobiales bacterium]